MAQAQVAERMEDHALESMPVDQRPNRLQITGGMAGTVTTLIQLFIAALVTFVAGRKRGILAGAAVTAIGALLGWGAGRIAHRTGPSSSVMSRRHGFGVRGSLLIAAIFGFMIIGLLAIENVRLDKASCSASASRTPWARIGLVLYSVLRLGSGGRF